jgi:hypothetical protein
MNRPQKTTFSFQDVFPDADFSCNREEEVFQYFQRLLSDKDTEAFELHLKNCPLCASRLADLYEANEAGESTSIDARKAEEIFQKTLTKLQDRLGVTTENTKLYALPSTRFTVPAYVNLILIGLVAALIYPSYKSYVLDKEVSKLQDELTIERSKNVPPPAVNYEEMKKNYEEQIQSLNEEREKLSRPDLSGSAVYSIRSERGSEKETIPVQFNENSKAFTLVFSVQNADFKTYLVEILQNEQPVWQDDISLTDQVASQGSLISIILKSESLKDGNYKLRISGNTKTGSVVLNEFKLQVKK